MKSPFTGGDAALCHEKQSFEFRKDNFEIVYHFYRCKDTNEEFTTTELDQLNMNQVYNLYRQKYAIPFPDEIKRVRELYGISALRMSKLLGFGDNQYRKYEEGEMPSVSNGKMISALKEPHFFLEILKLAQNQFPNDEILKIEKRPAHLRGHPEAADRHDAARPCTHAGGAFAHHRAHACNGGGAGCDPRGGYAFYRGAYSTCRAEIFAW